MCDPVTITMTVAAVAGAVGEYQGAKSEKDMLEYKEEIELRNRDEVLSQGEEAVQDNLRKQSQIRGSARASMASRGLSLNEGSALNVLDSVEAIGAEENKRLTTTYERKGRQHAEQAQVYKAQNKGINPIERAGLSLLGSAGNVASSWGKTSGANPDAKKDGGGSASNDEAYWNLDSMYGELDY